MGEISNGLEVESAVVVILCIPEVVLGNRSSDWIAVNVEELIF